MGLVPALSPHSKAAAGTLRNNLMVKGKLVHQKSVMVQGVAGDEPTFVSQVGFTTGRFFLMDANEVPSQYKTETRQLYRFNVPAGMSSVFDSDTPPLVGTFGPVVKDRITVSASGRIFDIIGVGDNPVGTTLETVLFVAEVI